MHPRTQPQQNGPAAQAHLRRLGRHVINRDRKVAGPRSVPVVQHLVVGQGDRAAIAGHHRSHELWCRGVGHLGRILDNFINQTGRVVAGSVLNRVQVVDADRRIVIGHRDRLARGDRGGELQFNRLPGDGRGGDAPPFALHHDLEVGGCRPVAAVQHLVIGQGDGGAVG